MIFKHLKSLDQDAEVFAKNPLTVAFDCFSVFGSTKGILLVFGLDEIISIKLTVADDPDFPVMHTDVARNRGVQGSSVVKDDRNSFLLAKSGKVFFFKSYRRLIEIPQLSNVRYLKRVHLSTYAVVKQEGINFKLKFFDCSEEMFLVELGEFDLSFPLDPVSAGGSRHGEVINVEMVQIKDESHVTFFSSLLGCELDANAHREILLMSIDEKLLWIRYSGTIDERNISDPIPETVTVAKSRIRGMKFYRGVLILLDDLSNLTMFYLCPMTNIVRKKEIGLKGKVRCYRFHNQKFIYSNLQQVITVDLKVPKDPITSAVDLKGITCFTIVDTLNFIIAICRNLLFYYIPINDSSGAHGNKDQFLELPDADIESIPELTEFIKSEEKKLIEIENQVTEAHKLEIFLEHINGIQGFHAGEAIITFSTNLPSIIPESTIVCDITGQATSYEFISIELTLAKILAGLNLKLIFYRHSGKGILVKSLKLKSSNSKICILMPAESEDCTNNKMSLDIHLVYDVKDRTKFMKFPMKILEIVPSDVSKLKFNDELDKCIEVVSKMKS